MCVSTLCRELGPVLTRFALSPVIPPNPKIALREVRAVLFACAETELVLL